MIDFITLMAEALIQGLIYLIDVYAQHIATLSSS